MTSVWVVWKACLRGIHGHIISDVEHHDDRGTYICTPLTYGNVLKRRLLRVLKNASPLIANDSQVTEN